MFHIHWLLRSPSGWMGSTAHTLILPPILMWGARAPHHQSDHLTPTGCPSVHLNSGTVCAPPHHRFRYQWQGRVVTFYNSLLGFN